jgi:hypothetical protein
MKGYFLVVLVVACIFDLWDMLILLLKLVVRKLNATVSANALRRKLQQQLRHHFPLMEYPLIALTIICILGVFSGGTIQMMLQSMLVFPRHVLRGVACHLSYALIMLAPK